MEEYLASGQREKVVNQSVFVEKTNTKMTLKENPKENCFDRGMDIWQMSLKGWRDAIKGSSLGYRKNMELQKQENPSAVPENIQECKIW